MKKVNLILFLVSVIVISCQKENNVNTESYSTITACVESAETKADMTSNDNYVNSSFVWRTGDIIKLFFKSWDDDKNQEYQLTSGANTSSGVFKRVNSGDVDLTAATYAIYPSGGNYVYENDNLAHFVLPSSYSSYSSGKNMSPLMAKLDGSATPSISFKYAGGAVIIPFKKLPADAHSISLTVNGKSIHGTFTVDPKDSGTASISATSGSNSTIWLNYSTSDKERDFDFVFPVPVISGTPALSFEIYNSSNVKVWRRTVSSSTNVARASALVMDSVTFDASEAYSISGYINGSDQTDVVRFHNNKATYDFTEDSYIYISHIDPNYEFWFPSYVATSPGTAYNEYSSSRPTEKMKVPIGKKEFTLTINDQNSVTVSYADVN